MLFSVLAVWFPVDFGYRRLLSNLLRISATNKYNVGLFSWIIYRANPPFVWTICFSGFIIVYKKLMAKVDLQLQQLRHTIWPIGFAAMIPTSVWRFDTSNEGSLSDLHVLQSWNYYSDSSINKLIFADVGCILLSCNKIVTG